MKSLGEELTPGTVGMCSGLFNSRQIIDYIVDLVGTAANWRTMDAKKYSIPSTGTRNLGTWVNVN